MNPRHSNYLRRLRATFWTTLSALIPLTATAESVVFNADFSGSANTVSTTPAVITPAGATWYGAYNKANGTLTVDPFGLTLGGNSSNSAVINMAGRVTATPITLAQVGNHIELSGSFYTDGLQNLAFGLYNSGGVDPLATLLNNGLTSGTAAGGTLGWKGYSTTSSNNSLTADFKARPAQTGTAAIAYELLSPGVTTYATPSPVAVGTVVNSPTVVLWNDTDGFSQYDFVYRITRSTTTAFAFTLQIRLHDTAALIYSSSGTTTAAAALPGVVTSSFDAIGIGGRVNATPFLQVTAIKVTAQNADIARITTQPVDQNIAQGAAGAVSIAATGTGVLSYQWYKDNAPVSGATSATYDITNAGSENSGEYHVIVSNLHGYEISQTVTVTVSAPTAPTITVEPTPQNVDASTQLTLSAEAFGVPTPSYQWYRNDAPIPDATLATYTVANALEAHAGNYKVIATNNQGSDTSDVVAVTINTAAPAITTQPLPVTVNVGAAINLTAAASGLPAPTYQWYRNDVAIEGATASSYSILSATTALAGTYSVIATNSYGTAPSNGALVTVNVVLPSVTTPAPAAITLHQGQRLTLNPVYAGSLPRTYVWHKNSTPIPGATSAAYTIASATAADAGTYHVVVTNEGGNATSANSVVTVVGSSAISIFATNFATNTLNNAATPITADATSWFIMSGRTATNSSVGDDPATTDMLETRPLKLTWVGTAGSAIVETAARFSPAPVALGAVGDSLRVRATLSGTNLRTLCFGLYNSGGVSPLALDGSVGGETTGGSTALGGGTQNWVGYRSSLTIGGTGGDIGTRPAQTGATNNRGQELLFPTGSTGAAFGQPAGVAVGLLPGVGATVELTNNTTYTLDYSITLGAPNQYTIAYALYAGASATGTPLYASNSITTAADALPSAVTTGFDALAFGLRNNDASSEPTLVITDLSIVKNVASSDLAPAITTQPVGQTLNAGDTLTLTAAAAGSPAPTWQWYKNEEIIPSATSATYTVASAVANNSGAYKAVATNSQGSATTDVVTVIVNGSANAYASWANGQGLAAGVNDGATQDPDNDGLGNLLEFALGGAPLTADTSILPVVARNGANLTLTYQVKVAVKTDHTIGAESSTDLTGSWAPVVHGAAGASVVETTLDSATNQVVVTVPASTARTFLRVKVAPKP